MLLVVAAVMVEVVSLGGAASHAAEYCRVERHDDKDRSDDGADDHEGDVEHDVDVRHLGKDIAVRQPTARSTAVHDADGEGREAGEKEAGDGLGEDDAARMRHGYDEGSTEWV